MPKTFLLFGLVGFLLQASAYRADVESFRKTRASEIAGDTGWASLTDLVWTAKGVHTVGRGATNEYALKAPSAPDRLGTITVGEDAISLHVAAGVTAKVKNQTVTDAQLQPNVSPSEGVSVGDMTRLNQLPTDRPITVEPLRAFPHLKDLVTDVSWNYEVKKKIAPFTPRPADAPDGTWRMSQSDIDRVQEFRKCIECFLCQDV